MRRILNRILGRRTPAAPTPAEPSPYAPVWTTGAEPAAQWSVFRTWWALTKLVLAGRGGYEFNVFVSDAGLTDRTSRELSRKVLAPYHLDWIGGTDRYATLAVESDR